jgi:hypothetical protein
MPQNVRLSTVPCGTPETTVTCWDDSPSNIFRDSSAVRQPENWGMRFNATKCYIMSIKKKTHTFYQLGGHILEQVDSNPYLGLQISEDLTSSSSLRRCCFRLSSSVVRFSYFNILSIHLSSLDL